MAYFRKMGFKSTFNGHIYAGALFSFASLRCHLVDSRRYIAGAVRFAQPFV